jgi:hypothetical protein
LGSNAVKRLGDVGDDVLWVFNADRQSDKGARDACGRLLLRIELAMRRRARMNREAARIADIGEVVEELQPVDETERRLLAALRLEADKAAMSELQVLVGALPVEASL